MRYRIFGERHFVRFVENFKDAVRRGDALLYRADDAAQYAHRLHEQADVGAEGYEAASSERARYDAAPAYPEYERERRDEDDLDEALEDAAHLRALHERLEVEVALLFESLVFLFLSSEGAHYLDG